MTFFNPGELMTDSSPRETAAIKAMAAALTAQRKAMYGLLWEAVDWYGIADRDLPEQQRRDIERYLRKPMKLKGA